jgi:hypothetical protein
MREQPRTGNSITPLLRKSSHSADEAYYYEASATRFDVSLLLGPRMGQRASKLRDGEVDRRSAFEDRRNYPRREEGEWRQQADMLLGPTFPASEHRDVKCCSTCFARAPAGRRCAILSPVRKYGLVYEQHAARR